MRGTKGGMRGVKAYPRAEQHVAAWAITLGAVFVLVILMFTGCSVTDSYVKSDRKVFDVVAPRYRTYLAHDSALTPEQRERRMRTVDAWEARIKQAERP